MDVPAVIPAIINPSSPPNTQTQIPTIKGRGMQSRGRRRLRGRWGAIADKTYQAATGQADMCEILGGVWALWPPTLKAFATPIMMTTPYVTNAP